jgi:hypothetical protein
MNTLRERTVFQLIRPLVGHNQCAQAPEVILIGPVQLLQESNLRRGEATETCCGFKMIADSRRRRRRAGSWRNWRHSGHRQKCHSAEELHVP